MELIVTYLLGNLLSLAAASLLPGKNSISLLLHCSGNPSDRLNGHGFLKHEASG